MKTAIEIAEEMLGCPLDTGLAYRIDRADSLMQSVGCEGIASRQAVACIIVAYEFDTVSCGKVI